MTKNSIFYFSFLLTAFVLFCTNCSLNTNKSQEISFTVLNGERVQDFCKRLNKQNISDCSSFERISKEKDFGEYSFVPDPGNMNRFEGLFRPGSYTIQVRNEYCDESRSDMQRCIHDANAEKITALLLEKSSYRFINQSRYEFYQQITLASIVEKEAASDKDYKFVSSVFQNRMKKGMVLGSCPTVEYALGYHRPFLLFKDIAIQSPYNVYKRRGLPPTPIAFFSDEALEAVRHPENTEYLFFVFDWTTGELHFSEKYEQHKVFASRARENFIRKFGKDSIHRVYPDKFYEL